MKTRIASVWNPFQACAKVAADPDGSGDPAPIVRAHGPLRTAMREFWTSRRTFCQPRGRIFRVAGNAHGKANDSVSRARRVIEANLPLRMQPAVREFCTVPASS